MAPDDERADPVEVGAHYGRLPEQVRLDETIASVDTGAVLDPDAVRNVDHHAALQDD